MSYPSSERDRLDGLRRLIETTPKRFKRKARTTLLWMIDSILDGSRPFNPNHIAVDAFRRGFITEREFCTLTPYPAHDFVTDRTREEITERHTPTTKEALAYLNILLSEEAANELPI